MTTLPQTTAPRLPRPMSAATGGMPAPWSASPQAQVAGMTGADVWRVLRANVWLIVIMLSAFTVLGCVANWFLDKNYARYTATGWVQVNPTQISNVLNKTEMNQQELWDPNALGVELRSQAGLMKTDSLFAEALTNGARIRDTEWFKQFVKKIQQPDGSVIQSPDIAAAKEDLADHYSVLPVNDSKLIMVNFTWKIPKDCRVIVEDLVGQHLASQLRSKSERDQSQTKELTQMQSTLSLRVTQLERDMGKIQVELAEKGVSAMPNYGSSPLEIELQTLVQMQTKVNMELTEATAQAQGFMGKLQQGLTPPMVEQMMAQDMRNVQNHAMYDETDAQAKQLEQMLGKDNPRSKQARLGADVQFDKMQQYEDELRNRLTQTIRESIEGNYATAQANAQALSKKIDEHKSTLGDLEYKRLQYLTFFDEHKLAKEQYKNLDDQMKVLSVNRGQDRAGIDWAYKPPTPDIPSFPKLYVTLTASIALGLMLALGIAFTREFLDTTVKSPRDIARVGQITFLGMIPHQEDDPQSSGAPLPMAIAAAPTSMIAEQFRQVRTRLQHAASLDTTRSILVSSPSPQDGKSTVATNIAAGLALNGRRILLVDANFRRPEIHKIFKLENDIGLSNVLGTLESFESATRETSVPNLSVMATGPKPSNPTELLESQLFIDFIERALDDYDHVIFDTGPMLLVSETAAMAPRVDGVITVVRAATNSRGLLQRMRDSLKQLKAEHLGVVLNGVRAQGGGYYGRNIKTYYEYQNGHDA